MQRNEVRRAQAALDQHLKQEDALEAEAGRTDDKEKRLKGILERMPPPNKGASKDDG